ncbi:MAG: hypothetical protein ACMV1D_10915, partial [Macromonas sp.]
GMAATNHNHIKLFGIQHKRGGGQGQTETGVSYFTGHPSGRNVSRGTSPPSRSIPFAKSKTVHTTDGFSGFSLLTPTPTIKSSNFSIIKIYNCDGQ